MTLRDENGRLFLTDGDVEIPVLFRYIRDEKNQKVGAVVAVEIEGRLRFGYAKYNPEKEKGKPNNKFALKVAVGRAIKRTDIVFPFDENKKGREYPPLVRDNLTRLYYQASKYFDKYSCFLEDVY